jgi:16S rRNA (uracil1498-N3)-methyltransferase
MHQFYAPDIETTPILPPEESHHAVKVLRLTVGDTIVVLDGKGKSFYATISVADAKGCVLNSLQLVQESKGRGYGLHIAIAPTKNMDRLEWFVEKAAEIGIDEISPIFCRFSERKVLKNERLEKILVSAMKQSIQPFLTKLNEPQSIKDFLKKAEAQQKFIAHCHDGEKQFLASAIQPGKKVLIMIGPEGDFSQEEVGAALQAGFVPVSLGESRLRVETAALVACHTVSLMNDLAQ